MTSEALALRDNDSPRAIEVTSNWSDVSETLRLCKVLVASRLLSRGIATPEAAFAVVLTGRELGLSPMQALRSLFIVEGKPTMSADLMLALIKRSPKCRYFKLVRSTNDVAEYETEREGEGKTSMSFTLDDAKAASLTGKDNWRKFPAAMLRARCIAALGRAVYPDVLLGVYETDELTPGKGPVVVDVVKTEPAELDATSSWLDNTPAEAVTPNGEVVSPEVASLLDELDGICAQIGGERGAEVYAKANEYANGDAKKLRACIEKARKELDEKRKTASLNALINLRFALAAADTVDAVKKTHASAEKKHKAGELSAGDMGQFESDYSERLRAILGMGPAPEERSLES